MSRILFLTFYFKPDLCAGSFRNSPLLEELARKAAVRGVEIDVFTTPPQRYRTYTRQAAEVEAAGNVRIERVPIPRHRSGFRDQILTFRTFYREVRKRVRGRKYDLIFASSSRLFTAYLGYSIARERKIPLYLDIRDIFVDTMGDVIKNPFIKLVMLPILSAVEKRTFSYATHINLISGGFAPYFAKYGKAARTEFTNGIDEVFIAASRDPSPPAQEGGPKTIVYAGNMGEGQGLHKVVPQAAKVLGRGFRFRLIGDGGAKRILLEKIRELGVDNVEVFDPVDREALIAEYRKADYLFIHLNDYDAFKRVLPSKIFELGVFGKPLLAGVGGYSREFLEKNLPGTLLFQPGDHAEMARLLEERSVTASPAVRGLFIESFRRERINAEMAESILAYLP